MDDPSVELFVFSYNRGDYLQNCIDSINACAPQLPTHIVDDDSTCPKTRLLLDQYTGSFKFSQSKELIKGNHGGLYKNMQVALESSSADYVIFMQDDMQLTRTISDQDIKDIQNFFEHFPESAFLYPVFLKGGRAERDRSDVTLSEGYPVYFRKVNPDNPAPSFYSDVCVAHRERLKQSDWKFIHGEDETAEIARKMFGPMGLMVFPFMMYLPEVPVFRYGKLTFSEALYKMIYGFKVNAFHIMDAAQTHSFLARDLKELLPFAEDFLQTSESVRCKPFVYNLMEVNRFWTKLHALEIRIRRLC
ncbi:MAG: glycosyltransferase family 2 protein [Halioglobus sp.]|nr:glycosyltransferase family 2 protein [Halioglobus sp.]